MIQVPYWTRANPGNLTAAQSCETETGEGITFSPVTVLTNLLQIYTRYQLHQSPKLMSRLAALIQLPHRTPRAS